jgi:hypothetical protein
MKLASFMFIFERGMKPLPNKYEPNYHNINLTTNYQLLLNCNKVHRAWPAVTSRWRGLCDSPTRHELLVGWDEELLRLCILLLRISYFFEVLVMSNKLHLGE